MERPSQVLRERRIAAGISQRQLARILNISPGYLNDVEHERKPMLGDRHVDRMPDSIRIPVVDALRAEMADRAMRLQEWAVPRETAA